MADFHTSTRVPVDDEYVALVGKAVYIFAYYEWTIIYIIDSLESGFVAYYSRSIIPVTSGGVLDQFKKVKTNLNSLRSNITQRDLESCINDFSDIIVKRNALIHAHPCTDTDGSQILSYQTSSERPLPDMKWETSEVEKIILEIDSKACEAYEILEKLRPVL